MAGPGGGTLPVVLCSRPAALEQTIADYAEALRTAAPLVGNHGLSEEEFWASGLFRSAVERLRGQQVASMAEKRRFIAAILDSLCGRGLIAEWKSSGAGDRHDYEMKLLDGTIVAIEAKGCLDGNNTNIFERPPHADEFLIWSLCQNTGADPRHNVWSGVHTRLSAEIIHRRQRIDGLIVWDMVCGTIGRPCPKLADGDLRATVVAGLRLPPPCLYLFPRSIPDPRNNPNPRCWELAEVKSLAMLHAAFHGDNSDVVQVHISADIENATVRRRTRLVRNGAEIFTSEPAPILRANR